MRGSWWRKGVRIEQTLGSLRHARTNCSRDRAVIQQQPAHADPAVGVEKPGFEKYNMSHELVFALKVT